MQRHGVGQPADMARHHRHRAELAHCPRVAQDDTVQQPPLDIGQRHAKEGLPTGRAQHDGRLLLFAALRLHQRNQLARHEREGDEHGGQHDARHGKDDLEIVRGQRRPEPSLRTEQQHVDQPRDDRRHRERQIDQRQQQVLAAKLELGDGPRRRHAEHHVERHRDRRDAQREGDGGQRIGLDQRRPVDVQALAQHFVEHTGQRHEQEQRQEHERHQDQRRAHPRGFGGGAAARGRCAAGLTGNGTGHVRLLRRRWRRQRQPGVRGHARARRCGCRAGASTPAAG